MPLSFVSASGKLWLVRAMWMLLLVALIGLLWWIGAQRHEPQDNPPAKPSLSQVSSGASAAGALPPLAMASAVVQPVYVSASAPPLTRKPDALSEQEWQAMRAAAAQSPNPGHELARMADYVVFQKRFMQWQGGAATMDAKQKASLGQSLLDEMPTKVAQGVLAAQQAIQIQSQIVQDLEADVAKRQKWLDQERQRLPAQPEVAPAFEH
jgi:cytoskeletal protein RodZ